MSFDLPDVNNIPVGATNWTQVHGRFLVMTPEEFGNGALIPLSKKLGVSKSAFDRHAKQVGPNGKNWWQERDEMQKQINSEVTQSLVKSQRDERLALIKNAKGRKKLIDTKVDEFLKSEKFDVTDENLIKLLDATQKLGNDIAKLSGVIDGGNKAYTFNLNVPPKYLTMEGRQWARKQLDNPSSAILEADFEEISDEEQMKQKQLAVAPDENKLAP